MKKVWMLYLLIIVLLLTNVFQAIWYHTPISQLANAVPDEETAIKIAMAVLLPIYGESIYNKEPYSAEYNGIRGVWVVTGSLPDGEDIVVGGVPEIVVRKKDGKIMSISHGM